MDTNKKNFIISAVGYHVILLWGVMFKFSWTDHLSIWEQQMFSVAERFEMGLVFFSPFISSKEVIIDLVLNCLIFIPSGMYLSGLIKPWQALLSGFALTVCVETTQLFSGLGGFSINDIFSNFIGAGIGVLLFKTCVSRIKSSIFNRINKVTAILFSLVSVYAIVSVIVVFPEYYEWVERV